MSPTAERREPTAATRIAVGASLAFLLAAPVIAFVAVSPATAVLVTIVSGIALAATIATGGITTFLGIDPSE